MIMILWSFAGFIGKQLFQVGAVTLGTTAALAVYDIWKNLYYQGKFDFVPFIKKAREQEKFYSDYVTIKQQEEDVLENYVMRRS